MKLLVAFVLVTASANAWNSQTPLCNAKQINFTTDAQNGSFDSTSHSGTLLIMQNHGTTACTTLPKPRFDFADKDGRQVSLDWAVPPGMHPGPAQIPVTIPVGGVVTARARWVSNEVYDHNTCVDPAVISIYFGKFDGGTVKAPFAAHVCGPAGKPVTFTLEPFGPDPTYKPSKR